MGTHNLTTSLVATVLIAGLSSPAMSEEQTGHDMSKHSGHDMSQHKGHSQAAVAGEHLHHGHGKGGWMFEYRYMGMDMGGILQGSDQVATTDISGTAMPGMGTGQICPGTTMELKVGAISCMAPTNMRMDMHMIMGMYGLTEKFTLMAMFNYLQNDMDMVMHMPAMTMTGEMYTSGAGDTSIGAMYKISNAFTTSLSVSIPTGATDELTVMRMTNPMTGMTTNTTMRAPYAMQLGSGTYDLLPSVTYKMETGNTSYGVQGTYTLRTSENDEGYTLGNRLEVTGFGRAQIDKTMSISGRLAYLDWDKIDGVDPVLDMPMMKLRNFTNDAANSGGTRVDLSIGAAFTFGFHLLGVEFTSPIQQDLEGTQMETDSIVNLNYQYMIM